MEEKQNLGGVQNVAPKSMPVQAKPLVTPVAQVKTPATSAPVTPLATPTLAAKSKTEEPNMMKQGVSAKKKGKGAVLGMILLGILAVGGISFGVWEMLDANTQKEQLNSQVSTLKQQNNELQDKLSKTTNTSTTDSSSTQQNPVIESDDPDEEYSLLFDSVTNSDSNTNYISIRVKDGEIIECSIGYKEYTGMNGGYTIKDGRECNITGLNGKIYKVVDFWAGHMKMNENIGFIMQDGTVQYFDFNNAVANNDFSVKKLNINGFVIDAFDMGIGSTESPIGGYVATIFVLSDGSNIKYTESML